MIEKANRLSSRRLADKNDRAYQVGGRPGVSTPRAVPKLPLDAPRALLRARRDDDDDHAAGLLPCYRAFERVNAAYARGPGERRRL